MNTLRHPLFREATAALLVALLLLQSATAVAPGPAWWGTQSVAAPEAAADDFAAANSGQLKYLAVKAAAAMNAELPGGAGAAINALVAGWNAPPVAGVTRDDYVAVNQGQLKHVAAPFYDRLGLPYPWAGSSRVRDDYQLVNLGQLKHVFAFELKFRALGQGPVQLPAQVLQAALDAWNALPVKPLGSTADDFDGDGIPNLQEYLMVNTLLDPLDLDGDRLLDSIEDASGGVLNKLNFADAVWDKEAGGMAAYYDLDWNVIYQGDGVMNYEEVLLGLDLAASTTSTRTDGLTDTEVLVWTLTLGNGLALLDDPVQTFWQMINTEWLTANWLDSHVTWLDEGDANSDGEPDGLTEFRADMLDPWPVWQPWNPDVWSVQSPAPVSFYDPDTYAYSLMDWDGDSAADVDRDSDGLPDLWEYRYALNLRVNDAGEDPDNDDLSNAEEYEHSTNPRLADSDGDGFDDGAEVSQGGDPLDSAVGLPLVLEVVSGGNQYVSTGGLSSPLAVKVTQGGQPVLGAAVEFATSSGGGTLRSNSTAAETGAQVTMTTGSDGIASAVYLAEATPGSAGVTATLSGGGGQGASFYLNILAGSTGAAPLIHPWGGEAVPPPPAPDADGDGIPDKWEIEHGLDPLVSNAGWDHDQDGFTDVEEYRLGSDMFDFDSRPLPSIEVREKNYTAQYGKYTRDDGTGTIETWFYGAAGLYGGETYLEVSGFNGPYPITNSPDRSQEMRAAFENGGYDALNPDSGWPYVFTPEWNYVTSNAWSTGDPNGPLLNPWSQNAGGTAMQLRLMPPTSANAPAEDWSRTYLVVEYSGPEEDYNSYLSLPFKEVLGSLNFSRTANGTKSVTFSGEAAGQVKISNNDRVEIIPREEMGQTIRIALCPIEFLAPEVAEQPADPTPSLPATEPYAAGAGGSAPGIVNPEDVVEMSDAQFHPVKELKIAKLTDAIKPVDKTITQFTSSSQFFLHSRSDPDLFRVRVSGLPNNPAMRLTVNLQTVGLPAQGQFASINDDATEIPMRYTVENGKGCYSTSRQFLVAYKEDDEYKNPTSTDPFRVFGVDEQGQTDPDVSKASDRTHRAALGSKVKVSSINVSGVPGGGAHPLNNMWLPVNSRKTAKVSVFAFPDSGVVENGEVTAKVWSDLQTARDVLAQVGITLEVEQGFPKIVPLPSGVSSDIEAYQFAKDANAAIGQPKVLEDVGEPSKDGKKLIAACTGSTAKFTLIYCSTLLAGPGKDDFAGYAYPPLGCKDANANHAFVAGRFNNNTVLALAHELCHLLTNKGHFGQTYPALLPPPERVWNNLMRTGKPVHIWPGIGQGCRLEKLQQDLIDEVLK
jgi:hypothetical protein